ncbi:MAG: hypothetical protein JW902_17015 [Syntrophaceae bacterium]|nr:hypothetical protein [Syntrophaceae bacterium]
MKDHTHFTHRLLAVFILMTVVGLFIVGLFRLQFDADVLNVMPHDDPVLADGRYVFRHHPIQERIVIDVGRADGNVEKLVRSAELIEQRMRESGFFREVGFESVSRLFPELLQHVVGHLPVLFGATELEGKVKPLLSPEKINEVLAGHIQSFGNLEGIGQADFVARDPLGFRNLVLSRLSELVPAKGATIYKGHLLSRDRKHLLVVGELARSGMDTRFAREIAHLMESIDREVEQSYGIGDAPALTPVGAYRAALDNEENAKKNVQRAVLFSTMAIALLLIVCFHRPLIGLLALLPAFGGTMMAVFIYSLLHPSISLMAVGFGGAIISFTVDYGLTYLLFLDRPYATKGMVATKEVWNLGLLAMLTTAVSFAFLSFSGFPALAQIGQFAALGVVFTYILVHLVFPLIFPVMPPAKRAPFFPLQRVVNKLASPHGTWKLWLALSFGVIMLFFVRPEFHVDPAAMNSVSPETLKAEQLIRDVWGDIFSRVYLLIEGKNPAELQMKSDRLTDMLEKEIQAGRISRAFTPSLIFPGDNLASENFAAWQEFWSPERRLQLKQTMDKMSTALGFAPNAFDGFYHLLATQEAVTPVMPERFRKMLGVSCGSDRSKWYLITTLTPGPAYDGETFFRDFSGFDAARVFDPDLFGKRLGSVLMSAFIRMAAIVGLVTLMVAFFVLLDWQLTLIAILPTVFAMICTLGTLNLMGEPLGIPMIMVSVVVIGMGTDYALYLVRSYQRYCDAAHPSLGLVRQSVFLSFATTFIGVSVLALSDNPLLKSAGLGLAMGVGYSFLGAFIIAPPLLGRVFAPVAVREEVVKTGSKHHLMRVLQHYRHLEAYPRMFARFKMLIDPMFTRLADFVGEPKVLIDIGTGYGVPAAWLLALHPRARLFGIEPDEKRVAVASRVIGGRGSVQVGAAPDIPDFMGVADVALMLDMIHLISDEALHLTLERIRGKLDYCGILLIRATVPSRDGSAWKRRLEERRIRLAKGQAYYRSEQEIRESLSKAGFEVTRTETSAPGEEEIWFQAHRTDRMQNCPSSDEG